MKYRISHSTIYTSNDKVSIGMNQVHLTPRDTAWQTCTFHRIYTDPMPTVHDRRNDYYGNQVAYFSFEQGYRELEIKSISRVEVAPRNLPDEETSPAWEEVVKLVAGIPTDEILAAREMTCPSPRIPAFPEETTAYARETFTPGKPILVGLRELLERFNEDFEFDATVTTVNTPIPEVFRLKRGVCQDFAQTMIAMFRGIGLPARYVSGYLRTRPKPGQKRLRGVDASHAWVSVFAGPIGWVDLDPTNNLLVSQDHVTIAWGRDYSDLPPVKGVVIGAGLNALKVKVDVDPDAEG